MHVPDAYMLEHVRTSGEQGQSGLAEIWNRFLGTKWKRARSPHSIRMYQVPRFLSVLSVQCLLGFLCYFLFRLNQTHLGSSIYLPSIGYNLLLLAIDFIYSGGQVKVFKQGTPYISSSDMDKV